MITIMQYLHIIESVTVVRFSDYFSQLLLLFHPKNEKSVMMQKVKIMANKL